MAVTAEQYVIDSKGRRIGVLVSMRRYRKLLAALEELEDIRAYDRAKCRKEKVIPLDKALDAGHRRDASL